jgi:hypothetical protein
LVICSCGWERETVSEWAAQSVSKPHPQLGAMDVQHVTRVGRPDMLAPVLLLAALIAFVAGHLSLNACGPAASKRTSGVDYGPPGLAPRVGGG